MLVFQRFVAFAYPTVPKKMTAIPAATAQAGTSRFAGAANTSAFSAGQTATHSMHAVHSADLIITNLSTGSFDGHAFAHFAQSIQVSGLRRILSGLNNAANP